MKNASQKTTYRMLPLHKMFRTGKATDRKETGGRGGLGLEE